MFIRHIFKRSGKGFTLTELMITVSIIGLLISLAVPNFLKNRRRSQGLLCRNNLRLIHSALTQYKINNNLFEGVLVGSIYSEHIVGDQSAYIKDEPLTPLDKKMYITTTFEALPTCPNRDSDPSNVNYKSHIL